MTPRYDADGCALYQGDALAILPELLAGSVQTVVTSPPYFATRNYDTVPAVWGADPACQHDFADDRSYSPGASAGKTSAAVRQAAGPENAERVKDARWYTARVCSRCRAWEGELGRERTPDAYVAHLVELFGLLPRLLTPTGTLWLNLGDCYAGSGYSNHTGTGGARREGGGRQHHVSGTGYRTKSLLGIPWRVALALQADGWLLRQCVIWEKRHTQPQPSAHDRPWTTHEYVFLLSRSARYLYREPLTAVERGSVWTYAVGRFAGHNAVMPPTLARRCIRLTSDEGDLVLDPFAGSGTTLAAAADLGRRAVGVELSSAYAAVAVARLAALSVLEEVSRV